MRDFIFEKIDICDSTNDVLYTELMEGNLYKDKILIAREQKNGHGQDNKIFLSPRDVGIYFTYLHFYENEEELIDLTKLVGVAIYKVFKDIFDIDLKIKKVNDLFYNDKKVAGILCKNIISKKAVLIGVGIDLFYNENIDNMVKDIAGYIFKDKYELVDVLNSNKKLGSDTCVRKNIYDDFKYIKIDGIEINDKNFWEADHLVVQIVMYINAMLKNRSIYENSYMECQRV